MVKTHHQMIREAVEALGEAKPQEIMDYIKNNNRDLDFKVTSFRADIIGCSVNHPSSHWYPGMPKFLFFDSVKKTYRISDGKTPIIAKVDISSKEIPIEKKARKATPEQIEIGRRTPPQSKWLKAWALTQ